MCEKFKETKDSPYGEISVRAKFQDTILTVELINGRNLMAMDSNGTTAILLTKVCMFKFVLFCF